MNATTRQFSYNKQSKMLVAELSDLGIGAAQTGAALRETLTITSHVTGTSVNYAYSHTVFVGEGEDREPGAFVFVPTAFDARRFPKAAVTTVHLLND